MPRGNPGDSFAALIPGVQASADYAMTPQDRVVLVDTSGGPVTVTLTARPTEGQEVVVRKITGNANAMTIRGSIDGLSEISTGATIDLAVCRLYYWRGTWRAL